jgi:hypothetical protein
VSTIRHPIVLLLARRSQASGKLHRLEGLPVRIGCFAAHGSSRVIRLLCWQGSDRRSRNLQGDTKRHAAARLGIFSPQNASGLRRHQLHKGGAEPFQS